MTAKNWIQFKVRDLVALTLVICLALAWWVERSEREELAQSLAQLKPKPWIQIYHPSSEDKYYAGGISMGIEGRAFFPSKIPRATKVTFEFLSGTESVLSSVCETHRVDSRTLIFVGNARMPKMRPELYFLKVQIIDAETNSVVASQGQVIEFVDD